MTRTTTLTISKSTVKSLLRLLQTPSLAPHLQAKATKNAQQQTTSRYNAIQEYVLKAIRENKQNTNNHKQQLTLQRFYELQKDLHERAKLYAIDTGAENQLDAREMSRRAAARAGLQLPILWNDLDEYSDEDNEKKSS